MSASVKGVVTVGGLPGSGTTTTCLLLNARTGLRHVNLGTIFRGMATERGMSLNSFGQFVAANPEIDLELDRRQVEVAREGDVILEGRLSGMMVRKAEIPALLVWLDASADVRCARVAQREGIDMDSARAMTEERERDEKARYLEFYGFDLYDTSIYDVLIDTASTPPNRVVDRIIEALSAQYA